MMPSVQGPRTKVTLACDACRKRRIKCSDTFPCSSCVETGTNCVFDDKYRGRRGPRARRPPKRVIHDLAPATTGTAIPILHKTTDPSRNAPEGPERWFDVRSATPATESVTVIQPPSNSDTDEEDASSSRFLGASKWTAGLEGLLSGDQSITNDPTLDINLMSHLLEIFYSHTSALIKQILPAFQLFEALADGTAFCGLILAACASSVRFSTHRSARPSTGEDPGIAARLAKLARASIDIYSYDMLPHLDQIRTICILVEYEARIPCGRRAWVDLATARSLTQLYRAKGNLTLDECQILDHTNYFIAVTEAVHCLGNASLQPHEGSVDLRRYADNVDPAAYSASQRLLYIVLLLSRIQRLRAPLGRPNMPWKPDSDFRVLHHELEAQLLYYPHTTYTGAEISQQETRGDDLTSLICSLVCHCCDVELNTPFLPIPPNKNQDLGSPSGCANFPEAPTLFLLERINRCESAAEATCRSARDIISRGDFFQYMLILGYCCMQSSFVLINQIHRALKVPDAKVVENLRFVFMVVAAVSKFYTQGKSWLNTMFRVYDVNTPLTRVSGSLEGAFDGYFSRFKELCEPSCVPLDPDQPLGDDIDNGSRPWSQVPSQNALDQPAQGSSWAADYAGHLSEYISDEGAEQGPYSSTDRQEVTRLAYSGQPGSTSNEVDQDYGNRGIGIEHGRGGSSGQQLTTERWPLTGVDAALLLGMEDGYGARFESSALAPIFQSSPDLTTSPFTGIGTEMDLGLQSLLDLDVLFADSRFDFREGSLLNESFTGRE